MKNRDDVFYTIWSSMVYSIYTMLFVLAIYLITNPEQIGVFIAKIIEGFTSYQ